MLPTEHLHPNATQRDMKIDGDHHAKAFADRNPPAVRCR